MCYPHCVVRERQSNVAEMLSAAITIPEPLAYWSRRIALFAAAMLVAALVLHRLVLVTTPVALNTIATAFALSALAVVCGLIAAISIWIRGRAGAGAAALGVLLAAAMWLWPLAYTSTAMSLPRINDISTDLTNVPNFTILARVRGDGANKADYPGERFARQQTQAYPDIRPLVVDRPVDEVFDLIVTVVRGRRGLGWSVLVEEQPSFKPPKPGFIEATERTTVLGFVDDIIIRVTGNETQARIDVRSASRFGTHDLGANASRIRRLLREVQSRLESTSPAAIASRGGRPAALRAGGKDGVLVKRPAERSPARGGLRSSPDPAPKDAQRAPAQKGAPRG